MKWAILQQLAYKKLLIKYFTGWQAAFNARQMEYISKTDAINYILKIKSAQGQS